MLAIIVILSAIEHMLPPIPFLPPNIKPGLSNIVTMYCVFFAGKRDAVILAVLKSVFVMLTRGLIAGILSASGGLTAVLLILLLSLIKKSKLSYVIISIFAAIAHNVAQLAVYSVLMKSWLVFYYLPVLIFFGIIAGSVTGVLLTVVMPVLRQTELYYSETAIKQSKQ